MQKIARSCLVLSASCRLSSQTYCSNCRNSSQTNCNKTMFESMRILKRAKVSPCSKPAAAAHLLQDELLSLMPNWSFLSVPQLGHRKMNGKYFLSSVRWRRVTRCSRRWEMWQSGVLHQSPAANNIDHSWALIMQGDFYNWYRYVFASRSRVTWEMWIFNICDIKMSVDVVISERTWKKWDFR